MKEHDTSSAEPGAASPSADPAVGPLVRLAALAHTLETPGAPAPSLNALCEGLAALGAAEPALERAALVVTAHARAAGLTWPEIAGAQGGRADALARRHTRRRKRFPDYSPPLAPTLEAYTAYAADLLAPALEERPASPFMSHLAAERLGAVLLTAHWERVDSTAVASWLREDLLSSPRQALGHHRSEQADAARRALDSHALDPVMVRAWLVDRMRAAVGAKDPVHVSSGARPAIKAAPTEPEESGANGAAADRGAASGYTPALVRAGLDHAAAAALAEPLAAFVATVEGVKDQQRDGQMRGVLHALAPVLSGGDPTRVRLLLGALAHLHLAGLEEWAHLVASLELYAPHLDERTDTGALVEGAGLSSLLARPLAELVEAARLPALASYAPGAPASAVADDLAAMIVAVDTANVSDLPALLDHLAQAERLDVVADQEHRLTESWEDLVYALTDGQRADALTSWRDGPSRLREHSVWTGGQAEQ